ncbi:MAG: DNA-protecting protein DprA [candidate division WOR-3 bacterium]|nr:DNA-protecting protein DprA [candidate division WOR-3 bacterium]
MMDNELKYYLLLQSIEGVGATTLRNLIEQFGSAKSVFSSNIQTLLKIPRINAKIAEKILFAEKDLDQMNLILDEVKRNKIKIITYQDTNYPKSLKSISNLPPILYVKGKIFSGKSIAIIGTREASAKGKQYAKEFASILTRAGYIIVSGYAKGIDTFVHLGAIMAGGKTIAVLPFGILKFSFHPELLEFADTFFNQATIISEFFPYSEWSVGNALARNRITSALADKILVVEAGDSGGTVNTVEHAIKQNKPVYLFQGISSPADDRIKKLNALPIHSIDELLDK